MSAAGPSRSRVGDSDRALGGPTPSSSAGPRVGAPPAAAAAPAASSGSPVKGQGGKKKRRSRKRATTAPSSAAGPSGPSSAAPAARGKRKRHAEVSEERAGSDDNGSSDEAGSSTDDTAVPPGGDVLSKGKGKERAAREGRRRSSKRSRSSVEREGAEEPDDGAGADVQRTTSKFFGSPAARGGPTALLGQREDCTSAGVQLEGVEAEAGAKPPLSALALGLRTVASPSRPSHSPASKPPVAPLDTQLVPQPSVLAPAPPPAPTTAPVLAPGSDAARSPSAQPKVDPALRERAIRLKLVEDLAKEKREREEEVSRMKAEMEQLRKEVGFKDSALVGERETLNAVKQSVTCTICMELLYQPYLISPCGHIACLDCLKSWFLYNGQEPEDEIPLPPARQAKHCPSCRGPVRAAPTPVFLVKDLVHAIGPTLRVLDGEDPSRPAPRDVSTDRDVWAGLFDGREAGLGRPLPVWDDSDGAWRCPKCFAEVADGECTGCGELYDDPGVAYNASLENSGDSDDGSDPEANVFASDEEDSEMDDFINDGDDDEDDGGEGDERADELEMLLAQGASLEMIERFDLEIAHATLAHIQTEDPNVFITIPIPRHHRIYCPSRDRDGAFWLANYLDSLPPGSRYYELWAEEKRKRRLPTRLRLTPAWILEENDIGGDDDEDDDEGNEDDEDDGSSHDSDEDGSRRYGVLAEDDDDLRQYGDAEEDELPAPYISDDDLEIARDHLRRQTRARVDTSDESDDGEDDDEPRIAPRRRVVVLDSDEEDDELADGGGQAPVSSVGTTSRHFRRARVHSSPSSVASSHRGGPADYSVDEGSDADPETRDPSVEDDDEDRDESSDDVDDEVRRERSRSREVFDAGSDEDDDVRLGPYGAGDESDDDQLAYEEQRGDYF